MNDRAFGISLDAASAMVDATLAEARRRELKPLAAVVLDAGGHLVAAKREDGASLFRFDIAKGKASGAIGMGYGTREMAARVGTSTAFYTGLMALTQGAILPSPGGVLILDEEGRVLGAIGVSGDLGDADEAAALAGIAAAGLLAQPGA